MDALILSELRSIVDNKYVGFNPNTSSIKPVHIANGVFLTILEKSADTKKILKFAYVQNQKGEWKNNPEDVVQWLKNENIVSPDILNENIKQLRTLTQKLVSADKAVFSEEHSAYTAGSAMFVTKLDSQFEKAGVFIGEVILKYCPNLATFIKETLLDFDDSISLLFKPLSSGEDSYKMYTSSIIEELPHFNKKNKALEDFLKSIEISSETLLKSLKKQKNKLNILRLFVSFCIFSVLRYLLSLESFYDLHPERAILADFSGVQNSSIKSASSVSYTQIHRSISSFYIWAFSKELEKYKATELMEMEIPKYKVKENASKEKQSQRLSIWEVAKGEIENDNNIQEIAQKLSIAIYDILALDGSSSPVSYFRKLAVDSGILYPPDNFHPNKRFQFSNDILEMILNCCVEPSETIDGIELRNRLWDRMRIIVGGREKDIPILNTSGFVQQIDEGALSYNFVQMSEAMISMSFAENLADGILQINLGGEENG